MYTQQQQQQEHSMAATSIQSVLSEEVVDDILDSIHLTDDEDDSKEESVLDMIWWEIETEEHKKKVISFLVKNLSLSLVSSFVLLFCTSIAEKELQTQQTGCRWCKQQLDHIPDNNNLPDRRRLAIERELSV